MTHNTSKEIDSRINRFIDRKLGRLYEPEVLGRSRHWLSRRRVRQDLTQPYISLAMK